MVLFNKKQLSSPLGCDTFVALPPATPPGTVVFGKNSDRPCGEGQSVQRYPARDYSLLLDSMVLSCNARIYLFHKHLIRMLFCYHK